jgi:ABC-type phosphate transport system auxiliary subunit
VPNASSFALGGISDTALKREARRSAELFASQIGNAGEEERKTRQDKAQKQSAAALRQAAKHQIDIVVGELQRRHQLVHQEFQAVIVKSVKSG